MAEHLARETLAANVATLELADARRRLREAEDQRDRYRRALKKILWTAWGTKVKKIAREALDPS